VRILLQPPGALVTEFSNEFWGSKVTAYYKNLENIEDSRWVELLEACRGDSNSSVATKRADEEYQANLSFTDHHRAILFDFSSPVKP
jgi:hypothetical protein